MPTFSALVSQSQIDTVDPTGVFHSDARVLSYLEQAELLLVLRRSLHEKTFTLTLHQQSPLYLIHAFCPDFISPLRVIIKGKPLRWTSLAAVGRLNDQWFSKLGEAESVFMVGSTILGFAPLPASTTAQVVYLALPPSAALTVTTGVSPVIGPEYQRLLMVYSQTVMLVKEGEYVRGQAKLKEFLALANISRDPEFLEGLSQRTPQTTRTTERKAND